MLTYDPAVPEHGISATGKQMPTTDNSLKRRERLTGGAALVGNAATCSRSPCLMAQWPRCVNTVAPRRLTRTVMGRRRPSGIADA